MVELMAADYTRRGIAKASASPALRSWCGPAANKAAPDSLGIIREPRRAGAVLAGRRHRGAQPRQPAQRGRLPDPRAPGSPATGWATASTSAPASPARREQIERCVASPEQGRGAHPPEPDAPYHGSVTAAHVRSKRALELGFKVERQLDEIICVHIEETSAARSRPRSAALRCAALVTGSH